MLLFMCLFLQIKRRRSSPNAGLVREAIITFENCSIAIISQSSQIFRFLVSRTIIQALNWFNNGLVHSLLRQKQLLVLIVKLVAGIWAGWSCEAVFLNHRPFPTYSLENMPSTGFSCRQKILGGYYADPDTECQMFHICVKVAGIGVRVNHKKFDFF